MENGWLEYQKLVLFRLDEHSTKLDDIGRRLERLEYFKLKVSLIAAGVGTAAGLVGPWLLSWINF